jgi:tetratricopeptide (TPR) repeat protein
MLTIRCTQKVLKKFKLQNHLETTPADPPVPGAITSDAPTSFLNGWYANLIRVDRRHMVVFVNEQTLMTVVVPAAGLGPDALVRELRSRFASLLTKLEIDAHRVDEAIATMSPVVWARTADRRVISSMNNICMELGYVFTVDRAKRIHDSLSGELYVARTPYKYIGYLTPVDIFRAFLDKNSVKIDRLRKERESAAQKKQDGIEVPRDHLFVRNEGDEYWTFEAPRLDEGVRYQFEEALDRHSADDLEEAERLYRHLIRRYPEHIDAIHHLAVLLTETGRHDAAFKWWKRAVSLGLACIPPGFEKGRDQLSSLNVDNRPFLRACHGLGLEFFQRGRVFDEIAILEDLLEFDPRDMTEARALLIEAYYIARLPKRTALLLERYPDDELIADTVDSLAHELAVEAGILPQPPAPDETGPATRHTPDDDGRTRH